MKILISTEVSSIHAARWINQLAYQGIDIIVFQPIVSENRVNEDLKAGNLYLPLKVDNCKNLECKYSVPSIIGKTLLRMGKYGIKIFQSIHEKKMKKIIEKENPDIIHSLGLNINWKNQCLPIMRCLNKLDRKISPKWLYSSWGTDLDYYAKLDKNKYEEVQLVLRNINYLITECKRDYNLAIKMGFNKKFMGYFTGFGGVKKLYIEEANRSSKTSNRNKILIKGRTVEDGDPVGRALNALKVIRKCEDLLAGYEIVVQASKRSGVIQNEIKIIRDNTKLNIYSISNLEYDHLMKIYAESKIFISLTVNDGIPSSLLEAMTYGVLPIFSNIDSIKEIIEDNINGLLVDPTSDKSINMALKKAINDNVFVDKAAIINKEMISTIYSEDIIKDKVIKMYYSILEN